MNYYEVLGVDRKASSEEIKRAYRKKQLEFHPDRNDGSEEHEAMFKNIVCAYEVLSDNQKRQMYDLGFSGRNSSTFDPTSIDPDLLDPDRLVNLFTSMLGDYLDQKIPGGFRGRVQDVAEMRGGAKSSGRKNGRSKNIKCKRCNDSGRISVKFHGSTELKMQCPSCRK